MTPSILLGNLTRTGLHQSDDPSQHSRPSLTYVSWSSLISTWMRKQCPGYLKLPSTSLPYTSSTVTSQSVSSTSSSRCVRTSKPSHTNLDMHTLTIKEALLDRKHTLKSITILNLQVPCVDRIYAIGSLSMFTALTYLCINQTRNGDFDLPPGNDLGYHLLNLMPTVETLELHHCIEYTFGVSQPDPRS
jgi:hypothetical protein